MTADRRDLFERFYQSGDAPWDTDQPQPALVKLVESGEIRGPVLDVGCGTGTNASYLAQAGLEVVGVDFAKSAIEVARRRRTFSPNPVRWILGDVRDVQAPSSGFASVLDIGVLHTLPESERKGYVDHLRALLAPCGRAFVMCFHEAAPEEFGNRLTREALRWLFGQGWKFDTLNSTYFVCRHPKTPRVEPAAWLLKAIKVSTLGPACENCPGRK